MRLLPFLFLGFACVASAAFADDSLAPGSRFSVVLPNWWTQRVGEQDVVYFESPSRRAFVTFVIVQEHLPANVLEGGQLQMMENGRPAPGMIMTVSGLKAFKFITAQQVAAETEWLTTIVVFIDANHVGYLHETTYDSTPPEVKAEADAVVASLTITPTPETSP